MLKDIGIRHRDEINRYTVVPVRAPYYAVAYYDLREPPVYYVKALGSRAATLIPACSRKGGVWRQRVCGTRVQAERLCSGFRT